MLPVLVLSQFAGTSVWFAGNAVLGDLQAQWSLPAHAVGWLTSAVQLGFIVGTLGFAVFGIADRFNARRVFMVCALLAGASNAAIVVIPPGLPLLLALRFATGVFLAGVYPVGMKIAASWFQRGLGNALGLLVGALVLGTAFPHLLKAGGGSLPWQSVLLGVGTLAALGGVLLNLLVPDGPHLPRRSTFDVRALGRIFAVRDFRAAAFGYFGHMWELYALWAFVPLLLAAHGAGVDVPLWSFLVIAFGFVGCAAGGWASQRWGSAWVAAVQLAISGTMCIAAPWLGMLPTAALLGLLLVWGTAVAGDSPQFSALSAGSAPREYVGTALTIVTSIGFFITIFSIQLLGVLADPADPGPAFAVLAIGPVLGLLALRPLLRRSLAS